MELSKLILGTEAIRPVSVDLEETRVTKGKFDQCSVVFQSGREGTDGVDLFISIGVCRCDLTQKSLVLKLKRICIITALKLQLLLS